MAQFDVHRNPNPKTNRTVPYLLDVQTDFLDMLATRVVAPHCRGQGHGSAWPKPGVRDRRDSRDHVHARTGIPVRTLGDKVATLKDRRGEIVSALDLLFTGA